MATSSSNSRATNKANNTKSSLIRVGFYEIERTLGRGNFAIVKLAKHRITKTQVAIKIIDKKRLDEENLKKVYREVDVMKVLKHPNIIKLYQVMETVNMIYIVSEFAESGEMFEYIAKHGRLSEEESRGMFRQMLDAVNYCHKNNIVHRDLKAENLLLDSNMNIKIADFGFSNFFSSDQLLSTWCGSPPYAAPEVFEGHKYIGPRVDVWSLGVILYVLVCGSLPFDGPDLPTLRDRVLTGRFRIPYFMTTDCESLIKKILVLDPKKRYTLDQIYRHKWMSLSNSNKNLCIKPSGISTTNTSSFVANLHSTHTPSTNSPVTSFVTNIHNDPNPINDKNNKLQPPGDEEKVVREMSDATLKIMQNLGMDVKKVTEAVVNNEYNHYSAIYFLLMEKMEKKKNIQFSITSSMTSPACCSVGELDSPVRRPSSVAEDAFGQRTINLADTRQAPFSITTDTALKVKQQQLEKMIYLQQQQQLSVAMQPKMSVDEGVSLESEPLCSKEDSLESEGRSGWRKVEKTGKGKNERGSEDENNLSFQSSGTVDAESFSFDQDQSSFIFTIDPVTQTSFHPNPSSIQSLPPLSSFPLPSTFEATGTLPVPQHIIPTISPTPPTPTLKEPQRLTLPLSNFLLPTPRPPFILSSSTNNNHNITMTLSLSNTNNSYNNNKRTLGLLTTDNDKNKIVDAREAKSPVNFREGRRASDEYLVCDGKNNSVPFRQRLKEASKVWNNVEKKSRKNIDDEEDEEGDDQEEKEEDESSLVLHSKNKFLNSKSCNKKLKRDYEIEVSDNDLTKEKSLSPQIHQSTSLSTQCNLSFHLSPSYPSPQPLLPLQSNHSLLLPNQSSCEFSHKNNLQLQSSQTQPQNLLNKIPHPLFPLESQTLQGSNSPNLQQQLQHLRLDKSTPQTQRQSLLLLQPISSSSSSPSSSLSSSSSIQNRIKTRRLVRQTSQRNSITQQEIEVILAKNQALANKFSTSNPSNNLSPTFEEMDEEENGENYNVTINKNNKKKN